MAHRGCVALAHQFSFSLLCGRKSERIMDAVAGRWWSAVVAGHLGGAQVRVHLPGRLGEYVPSLQEGLEIGQNGGPPGGGRLVGLIVGEILVGDGDPDDVVIRLDVERYR